MQGKRDRRTSLDRREIINKTTQLIILGFTTNQIQKYLKDNFSIVAKRTLARYMSEARKIIDEIARKDIETFRNEALARYYRLLQVCEQEKDYKTLLAVQTRIDKITGVETLIVKQNISIDKDKIEDFIKRLTDVEN